MGCDISVGKKNKGGPSISSGHNTTTLANANDKRILLLGLDNAGKTSILIQLKEKTFTANTVPTIGLNVESIDFKGINWTFWDVGG